MIYSDLNIGANKEAVDRHHLVNLHNFSQKYDVDMFVKDFLVAIENEKMPILVGGCGLYMCKAIAAYKETKTIENKDTSKNIKNNIYEQAETGRKIIEFIDIKKRNTSDYNADINKCNVNKHIEEKKIKNLLSHLEKKTHKNKTQDNLYSISKKENNYIENQELTESSYIIKNRYINDKNTFSFFLTCSRINLYRKIDKRCEQMILDGLLIETMDLMKKGFTTNLVIGRAIGYRDSILFLENIIGDRNKDLILFWKFLADFKKRTRNYARKQETFFRNKEFYWIDIEKYNAKEVIENCLQISQPNNEIAIDEIHQNSIITNKNARKTLKTYVSEVVLLDDEKVIELLDAIYLKNITINK
ncbi:hypothetical protein COBT_001195 [Conglomerata obtusa]